MEEEKLLFDDIKLEVDDFWGQVKDEPEEPRWELRDHDYLGSTTQQNSFGYEEVKPDTNDGAISSSELHFRDAKLEPTEESPLGSVNRRSLDQPIQQRIQISRRQPVEPVYCRICNCFFWRAHMKVCKSTSAYRLILAVGCVLRGTVGNAQTLLFNNRDNLFCKAHFSETTRAIYSALHIVRHQELANCSVSAMRTLMDIVRRVSPTTTPSLFRCTLICFCRENEPSNSVGTVAGKPADLPVDESPSDGKLEFEGPPVLTRELPAIRRGPCATLITCSICSEQKRRYQMNRCKFDNNSRLVLTIGMVSSGSHTIHKASVFLFDPSVLNVCRLHYAETIRLIYETARVNDHEKLNSCPASLIQSLMFCVNELSPRTTLPGLRMMLSEFCRVYKKF